MEPEHGKTYGQHNLPTGIKTFSMEFDMGLVEEVAPADRPTMLLLIEYVFHHIAKDDPGVGMRTFVARDPDDPLSVVYQLQCSLALELEIDDSHVEVIKEQICPLLCVMRVAWKVDIKSERTLLKVDVRSVTSSARTIQDMDLLRVHLRTRRTSTTTMASASAYESEGRSGSAKRGRFEKEK